MTVVFDGIASGLLLFLISVGLSVTLGLMNFVNLAHGSFAMLGGYVCVVLLNRHGVPFLAALPIVTIASALAGVVLERTLYRRLYGASHLDQVLFSIGLVFMSISIAHFFFGAQQQPLQPAADAVRPVQPARRRCRRLSPVPDRDRCQHRHRPAMDDRRHPLRRPVARLGGQPAHRARTGHRRRSRIRRSPLPSAPDWPDSAVRSGSRCSASIQNSRSSTSFTS
jgi:hypothetical protein